MYAAPVGLIHGLRQQAIGVALLAASLSLLFPCFSLAQDSATGTEQSAAVSQAEVIPDAVSPKEESPAAPPREQTDAFLGGPEVSGHTAWMLISCALVLFMTAPGLAMFYGGLVRKKNVLSIMMQCFFLMGMMTVLWAVYGYSLAFGGSNPYIGDFQYLMMNGVSRQWSDALQVPVTPMFNATLPRLTHMLFQGMFFIITPALICGAFAERMKFSAMVAFSILWGTLVYCPLAHWVWGGGILAYGGANSILGGALDFAGGTVVHLSSGVTALVAAVMIGPRLGYRQEPMPPHNLTYTALGASMLWVGWFGFNAGSALASDGIATSAFVVTHFSAAAGAVAWASIEWLRSGKPTLLGASSGAVAGLVCITPAAGHVNPMPSLIMGAVAGLVCYLSCSTLKAKFRYDDSLDAFGIHGMGGTVGAILTGVFATRAVLNLNGGKPIGMIEGNYSTIIGQTAAIVVTWVFAAVASFILLKIVDITIGLRVPSNAERQGMDITQHGEEGYIFL